MSGCAWADAVVYLLTSAYLTSVWCTAELVTAQNRGSRLLLVRAEAGLDHPLLSAVQRADGATDIWPAAPRPGQTSCRCSVVVPTS
jgi:hypothetical protein